MTGQEIVRLTNKYIGVSIDGYLGDFSYRTHKEFYPLFCNLDIDPGQIKGTTRERFQEILRTATPDVQARIVRGILTKYPPEAGHQLRTPEMHAELLRVLLRLEGVPVCSPAPSITSEVVKRAIADAETLIKATGATSGVDRIHTALHGYLKSVCASRGIPFSGEPTILALFTLLRNQHPAFSASGPRPRAEDITKICRAMGVVMDTLNPIRNHASVAHPNDELLDEPEAMLVINVTRSILHYLDAKLS
jgi:hypothetical protein